MSRVIRTVTVFITDPRPIAGVVFMGPDEKALFGTPLTPYRPFPGEAIKIEFVLPAAKESK